MSTATIVGGTVAAGLGGAALSSHAAGHAADTQAAAADQAAQLQHQDAQAALDFQKQQYGTSLGLLSPYYNMGTAGLGRLGFLLGLQPSASLPNPLSPQTGAAQGGFDAGSGAGSSNPNLSRLPAFKQDMLGLGTDAQDALTQRPGVTGTQFNPNAMEGMTGGANLAAQSADETGGRALGGDMPPGTLGSGQGATSGPVSMNGAPGQTSVTAASGVDQSGTGGGSFGSLMQPFGEQFSAPTGATEQNDPGYQFRLNEGMKALQNSAAAKGTLLTGGTAKDISNFGQDYASNEYGNVYNRAMGEYLNRYNMFNQNQANQFNRLAAISGIGQTSAGQLTNAGQSAANNISNTLLTSGGQIGQQLNNAAAARASGYVGSANAYSGALGGLGSLASLYAMMQNQGISGGGYGSIPGLNG